MLAMCSWSLRVQLGDTAAHSSCCTWCAKGCGGQTRCKKKQMNTTVTAYQCSPIQRSARSWSRMRAAEGSGSATPWARGTGACCMFGALLLSSESGLRAGVGIQLSRVGLGERVECCRDGMLDGAWPGRRFVQRVSMT